MKLLLTAAAVAVLCGSAAAKQIVANEPESNGSPQRPAGWEFRPRTGALPPTLAYDPCPGCYDEDSAKILARCPPDTPATLYVQLPDPKNRSLAMVGRDAAIEFSAGPTRYTLRGKIQETMSGTFVERQVAPTDALYDGLSAAASLSINGPTGSDRYELRGAGAAIGAWRAACQMQRQPTAASRVRPPGPAQSSGGLDRLVGTYDTQAFLTRSALSGLVGPQALRAIKANLQVTGPIERQGGLIVLRGQAPHAGGDEEAIVAAGPSGQPLEAGLLSGGRVTIFGDMPQPDTRSIVLAWARDRGNGRPIEYRQPGTSPR